MSTDDIGQLRETQPQREHFAAGMLSETGFATFWPKVESRGRTLSLFVNYLFVRISGQPWQRIDRTAGVIGLVQFGDEPARCPDAEVEACALAPTPTGSSACLRRRLEVRGAPMRQATPSASSPAPSPGSPESTPACRYISVS